MFSNLSSNLRRCNRRKNTRKASSADPCTKEEKNEGEEANVIHIMGER
jgi:hypothetical protein